MVTTFKLDADELDMSILKSIKAAFKGKKIEIIISDASAMSTDALLQRAENLKADKNTVVFSQEEFFKTYRKKVKDATDKV